MKRITISVAIAAAVAILILCIGGGFRGDPSGNPAPRGGAIPWLAAGHGASEPEEASSKPDEKSKGDLAKQILLVHLVGPDGRSAAGGRVLLGPAWSPGNRWPLDDPDEDHLQAARPAGGGDYLLEAAAPGRHRLFAIAPGCPGTQEEVDLPREAPVVIRLEEACRVAGTVMATDGIPIPDAVIRARARFAAFLPFLAKTDAAGLFALDVSRNRLDDPHGWVLIEASAAGFASAERHVPIEREAVEIRLFRESTIAGKVIDAADGRPIAGVEVHAFTDLIPGPPESRPCTDAEGRFEVKKVPPGRIEVHVYADEYLPAALGPFEVQEGGKIEGQEVCLRRGFVRRGRVVDARSGDAIAGAKVGLTGDGDLPWRSASSDHLGSFELRGLGEGEYRLKAIADGYLEAREDLAIRILEDTGIIVRLERGGSISGRVVDAAGRPVPGASLLPDATVREDETGIHDLVSLLESRETNTDVDGSFLISGLPPREVYIVRASRDGFLYAATDPLEVRKGETASAGEIRLIRGGSIRGHVVDDRRVGIAGAMVTVREAGAVEREEHPEGKTHLLFEEQPGCLGERTDASGAFDLSPLAAGAWTVCAYAPGRVQPPDREVEILEGESVGGIDLIFPGGGTLRGTVLDRVDRPIADAEIRVSAAENGLEAKARTDASGRFEAAGLPPGKVAIEVSRASFASAKTEATLPGPEVVLHLSSLPRVAGRIRAPGIQRFPLAFVSAWTEEGLGSADPDISGRFVLIEDPGPCWLQISVPGFACSWKEIDLSLEDRHEVEFNLGPGGTIECEVVLSESGEQTKYFLEALVEGADGVPLGGPHLHPNTMEGRFTLKDIPVGDWIIVIVAEDRPFGRTPVHVSAGEKVHVRTELHRGIGVHGEVRRGMRPVAGAKVTVQRNGGGGERVILTGPDGLYEIADFQPGEYEVRAGVGEGGEAITKTVSVESSSFVRVDFGAEER